MRVCYSTGLVINLNNADERILREKGKLVAKMREWKKAEVILNVVNKVEENEFPEEPGFHIIGEPSDTGPEFITRYKLFFS
ncbi:MAG TPA: hypothetical protein ENG87_01200, partial [Candidatus Pacearchaeota archaeon]|nr:hypothetical protein [Candidatus Pacearchaeota archaeon]